MYVTIWLFYWFLYVYRFLVGTLVLVVVFWFSVLVVCLCLWFAWVFCLFCVIMMLNGCLLRCLNICCLWWFVLLLRWGGCYEFVSLFVLECSMLFCACFAGVFCYNLFDSPCLRLFGVFAFDLFAVLRVWFVYRFAICLDVVWFICNSVVSLKVSFVFYV